MVVVGDEAITRKLTKALICSAFTPKTLIPEIRIIIIHYIVTLCRAGESGGNVFSGGRWSVSGACREWTPEVSHLPEKPAQQTGTGEANSVTVH